MLNYCAVSRACSESLPQELPRGDADDFLEYAVEVVGVFEAKEAGGFAYVVAVHQEAFALFDDE